MPEENTVALIEEEQEKSIFRDRKRTNILHSAEQATIYFLVKRVPAFITPNILTAIGTFGSLLVFTSFLLATYSHKSFLLLGIIGLVVNWFGDSLDGRIAYFRNIPRKGLVFSFYKINDWIGTVLIGMGYIVYAQDFYELLAFLFVVLYGWAMIITQLRYKITDKYTIVSGLVWPTEVRVLIAAILIFEVLVSGSIKYFAAVMCLALFIINIIDSRKLLKLGDLRDKQEKSNII